MTLLQAKKLADEAAESAQLDSDPSDAMRLLAEAVAEMARSLHSRLNDIDSKLKTLETRVHQLR